MLLLSFHCSIFTLKPVHGTYPAAVATIILFEKFNLTKVLEAIQEYKVTVFTRIPTVYNAMISYPEIRSYNLQSGRIWKSAAAPLTTNTWLKFKELVGAAIIIGWGLTETSPSLTPTPLGTKDYKPGMIGIPEIDTEVTVFDLEKC